MSTQRVARSIVDVPTSTQRIATSLAIDVETTGNTLVRLLVLDKNPTTPQLIENALWIWPHRISTASNAKDVVGMCQHLEPMALIVSLDFPSDHDAGIVGALRDEMPNAVIIAIGSATDASSPGRILEAGANAVLTPDELQQPTLYDLLMRLRPQPTDEIKKLVPKDSLLPLPWRESQVVGSLICDIKGTVTSANECLARWLCYSTPSALAGKCVWRDILDCPADWTPWKAIAGDMAAILHQSVSVKASNKQLLWMNVEVFAAPSSPTKIQAIFVDQSELAHLTGRSIDC